ncbi:LAME_0G08944g1_1 [Lachancea meyersii CBS 8951]|uniref:LAME_0G08944g1_1 n=1 Tax=Lachancea meyersii CBS 8951 TaxID=1266667 RepID=A0A1G4K8E4_9SACH|nr:LAME_0G08944g1_1 [Lachancea meyersii CBS 8951]
MLWSKSAWISTVLAGAKLCNAAQLEQIERKLGIENFEVPQLDFSQSSNGGAQLLGNYQDLNYYRYTGQSNFTGNVSNTTTDQRLIYISDGTFIELYTPQNNDSFNINQIVPLASDSFILSGSGSLSGLQLDHQVVLNLSTLEYKQIFPQALSKVNAIEVVDDIVYFGGSFEYKHSNSTVHSVISWDYTKNQIETVPFGGFGSDSTVNSILPWNDETLFFAGNFSTIDNITMFENYTNSSKFNETAPELGNPISLRSAQFDSAGSLNANQLICPSSSQDAGWLESGNTNGEFELTFAVQTKASKLRLFNSPVADEQVSLFRVITSPSNSIMNLTYLDPSTGSLTSCDAWCPLYATANLSVASLQTANADRVSFLNNQTTLEWSSSYQDFAFVDEVPISTLTFIALDSYGSSVGIKSLELFEGQISIFANNTLNVPNCDNTVYKSQSEISETTLWNSSSTGERYIYTSFDSSQESPSVNYSVEIDYPGTYTVNLLTPGCLSDDTCGARGIVNATVLDKKNNTVLSTFQIYQNNDYEKYDTLYSGPLSDSIVVRVIYQTPIPSSSEDYVMVADKIEVVIQDFDDSVFDTTRKSGLLNGFLQYNLANSTAVMSNTTSNSTSDLRAFSIVELSKGANIFVDRLQNTFVLLTSSGEMVTGSLGENLEISDIRVNTIGNKIEGVRAYSNGLAIIGAFNGSSTAQTFDNNGTLSEFPLLDTQATRVTNITLDGDEILFFNENAAFNVTLNEVMLNNSKLTISALSAGSNSLNDTLMQGTLIHNDFTSLNGLFSISTGTIIPSNQTNAFESKIPYDAVFVDNSKSIYACFDTEASSDPHSLMKVENASRIQSLPYKWPAAISALAYLKNDSLLAIGLDNQISGPQFALTNLSTNENIANTSWASGGSISSFIFLEKNTSILVGGNYTDEKSNCSGLCLFDYSKNTWSSFMNNSLTGIISSMRLLNETSVAVAGSLQLNGTQSASLAAISLANGTSQVIKAGNETIRDFIYLGDSQDNIIALSERNVYQLTNGSWIKISSMFKSSSRFEEARNFPSANLSSGQEKDNETEAVVITGDLYHEQYGFLNAIIYQSRKWTPYFTTSFSAAASNLDQPPRIFTNRDLTSVDNYQGFFQSAFASNSSNSGENPSSPAPSSDTHQRGGKKLVDRGFVVLIGLALSMGTVAVLGTLGVAFSYFFGDSTDSYQSLKPRIDENDMIDSVPPEQLMKFI